MPKDEYKNYILYSASEPKYSHLHEKLFRDKVYNFLYDGSPKLYKSTQEGNILIVLTDINFSPTNNLGRLTYSFNATATEIGECSIDNLYKYNIWNKNGFLENDEYHPYSDEEIIVSHNTEHLIFKNENNKISNINNQHNNEED